MEVLTGKYDSNEDEFGMGSFTLYDKFVKFDAVSLDFGC